MICKSVELGGVTGATLDCYALDPEISTGVNMRRPAMLILPGGAYLRQAHREGEPVAARFLGMGYSAFILRYSTYITEIHGDGSIECDPSSHYPVQVVEAMRAMQWLHAHADELWIDESRIFAIGFSAGAHILGSTCERYDDPGLLAQAEVASDAARHNLPVGEVLCYPGVSASAVLREDAPAEKRELIASAMVGLPHPTAEDIAPLDLVRGVRPEMPRTFIWQTATDEEVDPRETLRLVSALMDAGVPVELHLYERGPHGMALADATSSNTSELVDARVATWTRLLASWLAA